MMGFAVSTVAVILAAWFGYCAGRAGRRVPTGTSQLPESRIDIPMPLVRPPRPDSGHSMMCDCDECLPEFR